MKTVVELNFDEDVEKYFSFVEWDDETQVIILDVVVEWIGIMGGDSEI